MLRVRYTSFRLQKEGNEPEEYEDACYPEGAGILLGASLHFAVADGATESLLSGDWAALLTKLYKRHWQGLDRVEAWLARAYGAWQGYKREYIRRRERQNRPIQWFEEPGLSAGAFAAWLGLTLSSTGPGPSGTFEAVALGDSCLFQVRAGELIQLFPVEHSGDFNSRPLLLSSNPARNNGVLDRLRYTRGEFCPGDRFLLMTDALAAWFLHQTEERGRPPQLEFDLLGEPVLMTAWLRALRWEGRLRNDDVTCLFIRVL